MARAVDVRLEMAAVLAQLAAGRKGKDLEPAAVGQHRAVPCRETVHAARTFEDIHARTQVEVVGVGQDYLCPGLVAHVTVENALDRGSGTHGHEYGRKYGAVVGDYLTGPGRRSGILVLQCEFHDIYNGTNIRKIFRIRTTILKKAVAAAGGDSPRAGTAPVPELCGSRPPHRTACRRLRHEKFGPRNFALYFFYIILQFVSIVSYRCGI